MSEGERPRRPDPARTDPVRHASGAFRGEPATPSAGSAGDARAAGAASNPFAWPDDPVSRAVRAGCDVVESAVRRGFGLGRPPVGSGSAAGPAWPGPWSNGRGPMAAWTTGQWVDAMTGAFTLWAQWMDAWTAMARSAATGGDPGPGPWPAPSPASQAASQPPASPSPSSASSVAGALRLTVELRTARAVSVQLDLSPVTGALEVHGLLAPPAAAAPPITDVTVAVADGGAVVTLGSLEQHPAGSYAGAVLCAGRACGTLTVRLP
jgi:hypothetical protein